MHRSGNPRFDCAVSTGGARGPRVDHPSSEGVVLISPLAETNRKAGSHRYALAVAVFLLVAAAAPQVSRAQNSAGPTATLTPVALPTDPNDPRMAKIVEMVKAELKKSAAHALTSAISAGRGSST